MDKQQIQQWNQIINQLDYDGLIEFQKILEEKGDEFASLRSETEKRIKELEKMKAEAKVRDQAAIEKLKEEINKLD